MPLEGRSLQCVLKVHDLRGCGKAVLLAESLPQRLKAAKQSKVLTAALEALRHPKAAAPPESHCAARKPLRHPKATAPPESHCATPKPLRDPKATARPESRNPMEFFRNLSSRATPCQMNTGF
jgi:hypothetical protein